MKVKIKKIYPDVTLPKYQTDGSVAFDFSAQIDITIPPQSLAKISTGLIIATPVGYGLIITARSSLAYKKGLILSNGIGVVDQDYCGNEDEILLSVFNFTNKNVEIKKDERIAQGMFIKIDKVEWEKVDKMNENNRDGFGSTGI